MPTHFTKVVVSVVRETVVKKLTRSSKWSKVRKNFLAENSYCKACGSTEYLQVHHVKPFHLDPALELDLSNLITLCMSRNECHILLGHGDNYKTFNPNIVEHSQYVQLHPESFELIVSKAKELRQSQL